MLQKKLKPMVRYFNELIDHGDFFEKKSLMTEKLFQEYNYLMNVPFELHSYYPNVWDFKNEGNYASYKIKKINTTDASNYLINHLSISEELVVKLLLKLKEYLNIVPCLNVTVNDFESSIFTDILDKNLDRVREMTVLNKKLDLDSTCRFYNFESLESYCYELNKVLKNKLISSSHVLHFSHGDLCFSNILPLENHFFLIDPKGMRSDLKSSFRVIHYDLAKISQSILGHYDIINNNLFRIIDDQIVYDVSPNLPDNTLKIFYSILEEFVDDIKTVRLLEASMFLSMIPLHRESSKKMKGFLIRSLQIYWENS
jgi:hypothetical protein